MRFFIEISNRYIPPCAIFITRKIANEIYTIVQFMYICEKSFIRERCIIFFDLLSNIFKKIYVYYYRGTNKCVIC